MNITVNNQSFSIDHLVIAGWAGRNLTEVQKHIDELAAIGVAPPSQVPLFYHASTNLARQESKVDFLGDQHSGEVEVCVLSDEDSHLWVSVASDHTDRALEAHNVAMSKQLCAKPVADKAWPLAEVIDHWDELIISADIHQQDQRHTYQQGAINSLLHIDDILAQLPKQLRAQTGKPLAGLMLLCGTIPVKNAINCQGDAFTIRLHDPVLNRTIEHTYQINRLPINQ